MARKSRRANIVQEKKEELHISTSIITRRQLATAAYARLSVDKEKNDESIQNQIELLHQYIREHEEYSLVKITVMDQIHNMIKVMCEKKVLLEKMREGTYDKGELVSLRVKIQNMQYRLAKAEETSATLYENFATGLLDEQEYLTLKEHYVQEKEKLEDGINQAQARKRMVEKSIDDFLEIEKNLEQYLDDRSFNQKLIDELVDKIYVSSKGMIEVRMKCSDVFQKVMEIME